MGEFRMPSLGADMEFGTVVEWLVAEGDEVSKGDIVAVVDTDKADIDVEIFESGVIDELLVPEGERVEVGTPLARLRSAADGEGAPTPAPSTTPSKAEAAEPAEPAEPAETVEPAEPAEKVEPVEPAAPPAPTRTEPAELSPVLRRLAAHLGVDVGGLTGTGPGGAITRDDIESAAGEGATEREASAAPTTERAAPTGPGTDRTAAMRTAIGELMARSKREIPHYYVGSDIDVSAAMTHLAERNAARPVGERVLPAALLLKAAALALREVPELNGTWDDGFRASEHVHLGVAVRLRGGGLVAPALHDADELDAEELMRRLQDLVQRARSGRLRSSEMSDPTFTVTMLGDQGVDTVVGVIYPPQVALLGLGTITDRPWAADGMIGVRPVLRANLSADHRASDGITGARYLDRFARLLAAPDKL